MKFKLCFILIIVFQNSYAQYTDVINSNRPGESMSAYSVGKTLIQVESGLGYINENNDLAAYKSNGFVFDLTGRYGFFREQLEAIVQLSYQRDSYKYGSESITRSGLRNTIVGFKYLVYDPFKNYEKKINIYSWKANHKFQWRQFIPALSAYAGANINFGANDFAATNEEATKFSPKAMLITQNIFSGGYVFVTNIFMDKVSTDSQSIGYIATFTKGFSEKWSGFVESKYRKSDFYADSFLTVGAAYLFSENLQIDASVSQNFKDTPSTFFGAVGISWRFDANYEEVLIRAGKPEKDDSKKGKKKDKNKRLDEVELEKTNP